MKICRYRTVDGAVLVGVVADDEVRRIVGAADVVEAALAANLELADPRPLSSVTLLTPIPAPRKILAIGFNYLDHVNEGSVAREPPAFPVFFNKQVTSITGPGSPIHRPRVSEELDYEGELGVVVGRRCRHVPESEARSVIAGYVVANDVSVRDWQRKAQTMTLGKSFDTHCPVGPWLVTPDEVGDPQSLRVRTSIGGEVLQDFSTKDMLFGIDRQIAVLSTSFTLEPGDIVLTGTGRGVGVHRKPPRWLKAGETVRVEIERIGALENTVVEEPPDFVFRSM